MNLYEKVKAIADEKKTTIAEIERQANVANGTIGKWKTSKPNVDTLVKVADVLKVEITNLLV